MHSWDKPKILDEKELQELQNIVKDRIRGPHCNWCQFTYNEVESLLLTIQKLKEQLNVSKPY
jgi:hypothetical protein